MATAREQLRTRIRRAQLSSKQSLSRSRRSVSPGRGRAAAVIVHYRKTVHSSDVDTLKDRY